MKRFLQFVFAMVVSFVPALIGIMFIPVGHNDMWFNALTGSVLTPPSWVFGVAWTVLYALLGVALFLVIRNVRVRVGKNAAYLLFVTQMALNALWSYLFFGLHLVGAALVVVALLLIVSIWMMRAFWNISRGAGWCVVPYVLWLAFATYLNATILLLNY